MLSELVSHKRIDDAVRAFTDLALPLVVVGDGPDARRLKRDGRAHDHVRRPRERHRGSRLVTESRALVLTAIEEFGIAGVEAQAAGRPVIAQAGGGALETVIDGETGCFYRGGPEELARAVSAFDTEAVDPQACVENAARFGREAFREGFQAEVAHAMRQETDRPSEILAARRAAGDRPRLAAVRNLPGRRM